MINTTALELIPGDEIEIDDEMWQVRHHELCVNDELPVRMRLVACADRTRGKTVLASVTSPYKRAVRYCEDVHY